MEVSSLQKICFQLSFEDFCFFRDQIYTKAGIFLPDIKLNLVQARLRKRVLKLGFQDYESYRLYLEALPDFHEEWVVFINLLTTNKTEWFREEKHFKFITEEFLPRWIKLGKKHLRVWCAASSTGEEAYTLSLVLNLALRDTGITYEIIATDINTNVLALGENGVYQSSHLARIPAIYHDGFTIGSDDLRDWMRVNSSIKERVSFTYFNLNNTPYRWKEKFDLTLCRNVMIYFNRQTIGRVVEAIHESSAKESVLIVSYSETLQNTNSSWTYLTPSIYTKGKLF